LSRDVPWLLGRLRRYGAELLACQRLGATFPSAFRLGVNTLRFHARTAAIGRAPAGPEGAARYRARLGKLRTDLWLRTYSGDLFVLYEVWLSECYALPGCVTRDVSVVVDLGANVGLTTLYYATVFPNARFLCVEADADNALLLRRNVSCLGDRVTVTEAAASAAPGSTTFQTSGWAWGRQITNQDVPARRVRCITMPELMASAGVSRVDLLKVDIESGVGPLFSSRNQWLQHVGTIIVELTHDYPLPRFAADVEPYGLRVFPERSELGNAMVIATRRCSSDA
jgi:FkbM family methyltransferase